MSSAYRYRMFLRVMEEWPLDKAKTGRDLGAYIREQISKGFQHGEATVVDPEKCDRILDSLRRLSTDHHKKAFPRQHASNAAGLSLTTVGW
ncbi:hypothetical protein LSH36_167g10017 [Paralvinella palmiformis]|uniref:Mitochondrial nucleoid factor 1 n=1 Tax=Paralvinella palmiformis TaxID=53620 RepID=A0AAD9JSG3_9ANNE|nr:hypothetical protein LSH36_167g10017 [Paralvinella palmiformis]